MITWLTRKFQLNALGSDVRTEIIAGITTFLTMAYIIVVNPAILGIAGVPADGALFATIMVAGLSSILMGLLANLPIALAPGMGLNALFTFTLVLGMGMTWQSALAAVFVSGLVAIVISMPKLSLREKIVKAIPLGLRSGVAAGIGLFLAFIGLVNSGVIVQSQATTVAFGGMSLAFVLFMIGFIIAGLLLALKVRGALIISILVVSGLTILNQVTGAIPAEALITFPTQVLAWPSFDTVFAMDFTGILTVGILAPIFTIVFTDIFDSISTFIGISKAANLLDENGEPKNVGQALFVDSISSTLSGIVGSSTGTSYIESAAGVNAGGRSGLTAIVAGLLFFPFMFISPLLGLIPTLATAPVLVIVGLFMIATLKDMDWSDYANSVPAFIAMVAIPFTYSITTGIVLGIVSYTIINFILRRSIPITLWIVAAFSVLLLVIL